MADSFTIMALYKFTYLLTYCRCTAVRCTGLWEASSVDRCYCTDVWRPGVTVHWRLGWQWRDRRTSARCVLGHRRLFVDYEWYHATSSLQIPKGWLQCWFLLHQMVVYTLRWRGEEITLINPLIATLKPQSNGLSYSITVIGTLAADGWAVTFGTVRRGLSGATAHPVPSLLYHM